MNHGANCEERSEGIHCPDKLWAVDHRQAVHPHSHSSFGCDWYVRGATAFFAPASRPLSVRDTISYHLPEISDCATPEVRHVCKRGVHFKLCLWFLLSVAENLCCREELASLRWVSAAIPSLLRFFIAETLTHRAEPCEPEPRPYRSPLFFSPF